MSLGLSEVVDEDAMIALKNENRKKSTVNLSLGLGRMNSLEEGEEEGEFKLPGNPMLKVGLEMANEIDDTSDSKGDENLMSMSAMMSALGNNSLEGESWETKADTRWVKTLLSTIYLFISWTSLLPGVSSLTWLSLT